MPFIRIPVKIIVDRVLPNETIVGVVQRMELVKE